MFYIYFICFGVGLLFTLISAVMSHLFGGHETHVDVGTGGHADVGFDHTGMPGISAFSPTTIASFVTAFGGFGMIFSRFELTRPAVVSAPLAALCGLGVAAGVFWMFHYMFTKTQSSSESRVSTLVGQSATIITPIPENGVGEIAYVQGGSRYTAPARGEQGSSIAAGRAVKITRTTGSQFFVETV